jgi:molybdenum cofactor biosynthesis enzyme MoaA
VMFLGVKSYSTSFSASCASKKATWTKSLKWCFKYANGP